uniref:Serrate RNA effector molecule homolog n=1 Tax=Globodera rostochiensis TaxID=31243 RepID=A0A914HB15_GLORO
MVYDEEPDERRREKFSRERGGGQQDFRRPFERSKRGDFAANGAMKRTFRGGGGDDDQHATKRGRFEAASESYEPTFHRRDSAMDSDGGGTTTLLTFKKFLATQDESLSDEEAITKYNDYKFEVLRQECERYFQSHKDEEWFRFKYHPEDSRSAREEQRSDIRKRLSVFNDFLDNGIFDNIRLDIAHSDPIIRLMDAVIVKLEGGTNADIDAIKDEPIEDESVQDLLRERESEKGDVGNDGSDQTGGIVVTKTVSSEGDEIQKQQNEGKNVKTSDEEGGATSAEEPKAERTEITHSVILNKQADQSQHKLATHPHQMHKTCSVLFRSVPANAFIADLENLCKQHPGFLRLAVGDPVFDSRGTRVRPAWVTYRRDVNINEIALALRRAKLLASDLGVMVNRDLKRRVRISSADADAASVGSVFTSALDSHRAVAANALRQAARLIVLLDLREGLHGEKTEMEEGEEEGGVGTGESDTIGRGGGTEDEVSKLLSDLDDAVLHSRNPILSGIVNYMVEESSAEEEFLLERACAADGTPLEITQQYEEDRALIQMLDRLLLYLRIVHSVDFYAALHYPQEDQMPNRLGLFHVRRIPPSIAAAKRAPQLAKSTVDGHVESFNARFENGILKKCTPLAERELQKLGKKDAEKAVEEFVNVNTQQLGPEKWLCPLSGKKFKGPEFVHKHITTKYKEEVDKMRHEALYFNNFITDPNRPHNPQLFEQPKTRVDARSSIETGTHFSHQSQHSSHVRDRVDSALEPPAERISFQRNAPSWGGGGTYGGDRYGGSSRYSGARPVMNTGGWRRMEPMNETAIRGVNGGGGEGMRDPRAPPSYKDLDAPTEDII